MTYRRAVLLASSGRESTLSSTTDCGLNFYEKKNNLSKMEHSIDKTNAAWKIASSVACLRACRHLFQWKRTEMVDMNSSFYFSPSVLEVCLHHVMVLVGNCPPTAKRSVFD